MSESVSWIQHPHQHIVVYSGDRVFPVSYLHWYWQPERSTETEHKWITTQKVHQVNSTKHVQRET